MDKQREAFEKYLLSTDKFKFRNKTFLFMLDENGVYEDTPVLELWQAWQQAQKSAVPEGFVLVEKKILLEGVNKIEQLFEDDPLLALGELLPIQQGLKAMIEAQEQVG